MKKRIKITKDQLNEFEKNDFSYWDEENDTKPYNISDITADGYLNDEEFGEPVTDADELTAQGYIMYRNYGRPTGCLYEDTWGDPTKGENPLLNTLTEKPEDNLVSIPKGVETKANILLESVINLCRNPKQHAMVLNKLIEGFKLGGLPLEWKKELMGKIMNNHKK